MSNGAPLTSAPPLALIPLGLWWLARVAHRPTPAWYGGLLRAARLFQRSAHTSGHYIKPAGRRKPR
jgi:hypothetical protein